jgi:hypothetical protein
MSNFTSGNELVQKIKDSDLVQKITDNDLVKKLKESPTVQTITALTSNKAKEVVKNLTKQQAVALVQKIQSSPKAKEMAQTPLVQELKKVIVSPIDNNETIQDAEVIESTVTKANQDNNTMKYVAVGAATLTGLYLISRTFANREPASKKSAKADLQGTPKKSSRAKKTLAISM